jgi:hypothetical protein
MKIYNTKRGAQNQATRLNKIESANNTLKFWEVEMIVFDSKLVYVIEDCSTGISEIFGA